MRGLLVRTPSESGGSGWDTAPPLSLTLVHTCEIEALEKFSYRKRTFLTPVSSGICSYVLAEVESSDGGQYKCGHNMITLADCRRQIQLEFCLGTPRDRKQSLAKIDLLVEVFSAFRTALQQEVQLIAKDNVGGRVRRQRKRQKN
jgi:hypothetical protein